MNSIGIQTRALQVNSFSKLSTCIEGYMSTVSTVEYLRCVACYLAVVSQAPGSYLKYVASSELLRTSACAPALNMFRMVIDVLIAVRQAACVVEAGYNKYSTNDGTPVVTSLSELTGNS